MVLGVQPIWVLTLSFSPAAQIEFLYISVAHALSQALLLSFLLQVCSDSELWKLLLCTDVHSSLARRLASTGFQVLSFYLRILTRFIPK